MMSYIYISMYLYDELEDSLSKELLGPLGRIRVQDRGNWSSVSAARVRGLAKLVFIPWPEQCKGLLGLETFQLANFEIISRLITLFS